MAKIVWKSPLRIQAFSLGDIVAAKLAGTIPRNADSTQPWCMLLEPLRLFSSRCGDVEIPAGFIYDQASIPWAARQWMGPSDPRIARAACWHDWLSPWTPDGEVPTWTHNGQTFKLNKEGAAEELFDGMRADGANWMDAAMVSRAVKTFQKGWKV